MQISKKLPNFRDNKSLLVVASKHCLEVYLAYNEKINKINELKIESPTFSDREGFFKRSGKGEVYRSGAVYEEQKAYIRKMLSIESKEAIVKSTDENQAEAIYLFVPNQLKNVIKEKLPERIKKLINVEFNGHFIGKHPFELIKQIQSHEAQIKDKRSVPVDDEVKRILKSNKVKV